MKTDTLKPFKLVKKNKTKDQFCSINTVQLISISQKFVEPIN